MKDGLGRRRERSDDEAPADRYVLLPGRTGLRRFLPNLSGPGAALSRVVPGLNRLLPAGRPARQRQMAEVGAVAGVAVVVLALVGATVMLRPSSSPPPDPTGPGLPARPGGGPRGPGAAAPSGSSSPVLVPGPSGRAPSYSARPLPTGSPAYTATATATTPAPGTSPAPAPGPTTSVPPSATVPPPPSPTVSPTLSPTPSPTTPTVSPTVVPPVGQP